MYKHISLMLCVAACVMVVAPVQASDPIVDVNKQLAEFGEKLGVGFQRISLLEQAKLPKQHEAVEKAEVNHEIDLTPRAKTWVASLTSASGSFFDNATTTAGVNWLATRCVVGNVNLHGAFVSAATPAVQLATGMVAKVPLLGSAGSSLLASSANALTNLPGYCLLAGLTWVAIKSFKSAYEESYHTIGCDHSNKWYGPRFFTSAVSNKGGFSENDRVIAYANTLSPIQKVGLKAISFGGHFGSNLYALTPRVTLGRLAASVFIAGLALKAR